MLNYSPEYEQGERFMVIRLENERSSDYAHIEAYVVRQAVASRVNPDTNREEYNDGKNAIGFRNCSWSSNKKSALYVEDLKVKSQITKRNFGDGSPVAANEQKPYGIECVFKSYSVDRNEAKHIARTFDALDKKMDKMAEEFGRCGDDLAQHIIRVAKSLGIKRFLTPPKAGGYGSQSLETGDYRVWDVTDVDFIVNNYLRELQPAKVE